MNEKPTARDKREAMARKLANINTAISKVHDEALDTISEEIVGLSIAVNGLRELTDLLQQLRTLRPRVRG